MRPDLPIKSIPRPTFARVFAETATAEVLYWIAEQTGLKGEEYRAFIATLPEQKSDGRDLTDLLESLATHPELQAVRRDGFAYCEKLKTALNWPVNAKLVEILTDNIKDTLSRQLRLRTIEWVMRTGHRFNAKVGAEVKFIDPEQHVNRSGKVLSVDLNAATATVATQNSGEKTVLAEHVIMWEAA